MGKRDSPIGSELHLENDVAGGTGRSFIPDGTDTGGAMKGTFGITGGITGGATGGVCN